jgi:hypothetical protein
MSTHLGKTPQLLFPDGGPKRSKVCYDLIRQNESLIEKPSSEAAGIIVEGENKWMTLIQNAKLSQ